MAFIDNSNVQNDLQICVCVADKCRIGFFKASSLYAGAEHTTKDVRSCRFTLFHESVLLKPFP